MKPLFGFLRRAWKAETFSPTAFVVRAIAVTVLFAVSELLGLREYTTFLSGTSANVNLGWSLTSALGLTHLLLYVAFILLAPIFLITAGLLAAWNRWKRVASGTSPTADGHCSCGGDGLPCTHEQS